MLRVLRWLAILLLVAFLGIQFVRPEKNLSPGPIPAEDLRILHPMPAAIRQKLEVSCYDCHSNQTRYPWYAEIQPLGWWLDQHLKDGKRELNLSTFGSYPLSRQVDKLDAIIDSVKDRTMPLPSYTWTHFDAKFSDEEVAALVVWAETLRDKIEEEL